MHFRRVAAISALFVGTSIAASVPANVKAFYDEVVASKKCAKPLADGFTADDKHKDSVAYCGDHVDDYNVIYLQGTNGDLADMDIDCDGIQKGPLDDGRCHFSTDTQGVTSFQSDLEDYNVGIKDLDAFEHPYVVFGNEGSDKGGHSQYATFEPEDAKVEPLSIIAVVCDNKLLFAIWGDTNGNNGDAPMVGEASISLASLCFGKDAVNGDAGHTENDVLYIAFPGKDAVPGADGADWTAKDPVAFEKSLQKLGNKLIARIGGGSGGGSSSGSDDSDSSPTTLSTVTTKKGKKTASSKEAERTGATPTKKSKAASTKKSTKSSSSGSGSGSGSAPIRQNGIDFGGNGHGNDGAIGGGNTGGVQDDGGGSDHTGTKKPASASKVKSEEAAEKSSASATGGKGPKKTAASATGGKGAKKTAASATGAEGAKKSSASATGAEEAKKSSASATGAEEAKQSSASATGADEVIFASATKAIPAPTGEPSTGEPSDGGCSWAGHCAGAVCSNRHDCSGELVCNNGICGEDYSKDACEWKGHCAGAKCSDENDCTGELVCNSGICGAKQ